MFAYFTCVYVGVFYNPDKVIFANAMHDKSQDPHRYADRSLYVFQGLHDATMTQN